MHNNLNTFRKIILDPKQAKRFISGYPWIYSNEILNIAELKDLKLGEITQVSYRDTIIAIGYFNRHSLISFRVLSRNPFEIINEDFFSERFVVAQKLREKIFSLPYYRLVYAESDNLPGLIVDRFDEVLVVQVNTAGMENLKSFWLMALTETYQPKTIIIHYDTLVRSLEGLTIEKPDYIGKKINSLKVIENDTEFAIDLEHSQKTGWFFDHRDNRLLIAGLAKNQSVLDYFCYSGGFSVTAAKKGAKTVMGVDRSEQAIQNAYKAAEINQVSEKCQFVCSDIFKDLEKRITHNETYDIVVLDPPAFIKSKKDLPAGLKGYEKLLTQAIQCVKKRGFLFFASCSYHSTEADLQMLLQKALVKNKRSAKIIKRISAGLDHPMHPFLKESEYLKGFLISF